MHSLLRRRLDFRVLRRRRGRCNRRLRTHLMHTLTRIELRRWRNRRFRHCHVKIRRCLTLFKIRIRHHWRQRRGRARHFRYLCVHSWRRGHVGVEVRALRGRHTTRRVHGRPRPFFVGVGVCSALHWWNLRLLYLLCLICAFGFAPEEEGQCESCEKGYSDAYAYANGYSLTLREER